MNINTLLAELIKLQSSTLKDQEPLMLTEVGDACHIAYIQGEENICPNLVLSLNGLTFADHKNLNEVKPMILQTMENMLNHNFKNTYNADACSYKYQWDSTHRGYSLYVTIIITDYLS